MGMQTPKTIAVAVSGGVDSLCALLCLKKSGQNIFALYGSFFDGKNSQQAVQGLAIACHKLKIRLHTVNLKDMFQREVVDRYARALADGITPNPCALCNRSIKFGALLGAAKALGANFLATGHYARIEQNAEGQPMLAVAADDSRDQSYFLSLVPAERLRHVLFPLAGLKKIQCKKMVREAGLAVPVPGESQDICFTPHDPADHASFLARQWQRMGLATPRSGPVLLQTEPSSGDTSSAHLQSVGEHQGLWRYTEGQRKGLGIAYSEPLHILSKNRQENTLIVGPRQCLGMTACQTQVPNFFVPPEQWPDETFVRLRYRQDLLKARVSATPEALSITLAEKQFPTAPGQIAAVYDAQGHILAGAVIATVA